MQICPHCGQQVREGLAVCPFCGVDMATDKTPFPFNTEAQQVTNGAALGCGLSFLLFIGVGFLAVMHSIMRDAHTRHGVPPAETWPVWTFPALQALPLVAVVVLYLVLRRRAPLFARGLLYSLFSTAALSLGAFAVCR